MSKSRQYERRKDTVEFEPKSRRAISNAQAVRDLVATALNQFNGDPFPAMSTHFRVPGAIGSVLLPHEYPREGLSDDHPIEDWGLATPHGFNSLGEYE